MGINDEMIKKSYTVAKKVYDNEIELSNGAYILNMECNMDVNSAKDYIGAFLNMRNGEQYERTIKDKANRYFLENIHKDYGYDGLQTALNAVRLHIEYQRGGGHNAVNYNVSIYEEFMRIRDAE